MTKTYECTKCGRFNAEVKMNDPEVDKCPTCGEKVKRIYNATSAIWKTSGAFGKSR